MPEMDDWQRFQWRKKGWLLGTMAFIGLSAIVIFSGC
jgi:hypothetical protein